MYGLKGKVDVSAEIEIQEPLPAATLRSVSAGQPATKGRKTWPPPAKDSGPRRALTDGNRSTVSTNAPMAKTLIVAPLELKTGKSSYALEHRAQTLLYTLLMSDRYGEFGFLGASVQEKA